MGLQVLGGLTAEQFLTEYWQKKPLLVRNAIPEINGLLVPQDILDLAVEEVVTARLLTQHGQFNENWKVKTSPLNKKDLKKLPSLWTLLVQAVDHFSPDIAALWQHFDFIPQWRRDDIMVSYAPKGGSVGRHYDQYDVFLVQGYGKRRWQLGQYCQPDCELIPDQPLRLLPDMEVHFDEILEPGDLLYVPPTLSHYGVAENDCLTFSFGFRMPNATQLLDELTDQLLDVPSSQLPIADQNTRQPQAAGAVSQQDLQALKQYLVQMVNQDEYFTQAALSLLSEIKYPDSLPENDPITHTELLEALQTGATIQREPATRLLYTTDAQDQLQFWALGEKLEVNTANINLLKRIADGAVLGINDIDPSPAMLEQLCHLYEDAILLINMEDEG
ncbi:JmjC domain-containing protein [Alkanindiges sp. WGS2144]|uniref:JmjC domain-containing protein n=1 Tax=Alkanindiges sp. WGS2144 TaxID=3366808 RepID=UPI003750562E